MRRRTTCRRQAAGAANNLAGAGISAEIMLIGHEKLAASANVANRGGTSAHRIARMRHLVAANNAHGIGRSANGKYYQAWKTPASAASSAKEI